MLRIQRRWIVVTCVAALVLLAAVLLVRSRSRAQRYATATVDRGDILDTVGATGTLQAVTTVQVGSQVSGIVDSLAADFNSRVRKGQVIARLDPSLFQARLGQARANLTAAQANADRARATVADTRQKLARAKELSSQQLLPETDLETAQANYDSAAAQLKASNAAVVQAEASVNQAEVDLNHTIIAAPIDGVVIARNFDVGQTVAASFQAPTLFVIANDLAQMQVNASIDEADIGRVREGQQVSFRVDAYPDRTFAGRLDQIRLQPVTSQNVVTYSAIVSADNPRGQLMPGMTATVSIIVAQRENALRVPAAALRFRPEGASPSRDRSAARASGSGAGRERQHSSRDRGPRARNGERTERAPTAATSDEQDAAQRRGHLYAFGPDEKPARRDVVLGISDGQYVELCEGFQEGETVVTGLATGATAAGARSTNSTPNNPFAPRRPERRTR